MLKGIPEIISPELIKVLMEMGHGDEIVIGDGNFPSSSKAQRLVRADGHGNSELLKAILKFFPLDIYVDKSVSLMSVVPDDDVDTPIWEEYREIIRLSGEKFRDFEFLDRSAFYKRAEESYAIIATGEKSLYACVILKKGVIKS